MNPVLDGWPVRRSGSVKDISHQRGAGVFRRRTVSDDSTPEPLRIIHLTRWEGKRDGAKDNGVEGKEAEGGERDGASAGVGTIGSLRGFQKITERNSKLKRSSVPSARHADLTNGSFLN